MQGNPPPSPPPRQWDEEITPEARERAKTATANIHAQQTENVFHGDGPRRLGGEGGGGGDSNMMGGTGLGMGEGLGTGVGVGMGMRMGGGMRSQEIGMEIGFPPPPQQQQPFRGQPTSNNPKLDPLLYFCPGPLPIPAWNPNLPTSPFHLPVLPSCAFEFLNTLYLTKPKTPELDEGRIRFLTKYAVTPFYPPQPIASDRAAAKQAINYFLEILASDLENSIEDVAGLSMTLIYLLGNTPAMWGTDKEAVGKAAFMVGVLQGLMIDWRLLLAQKEEWKELGEEHGKAAEKFAGTVEDIERIVAKALADLVETVVKSGDGRLKGNVIGARMKRVEKAWVGLEKATKVWLCMKKQWDRGEVSGDRAEQMRFMDRLMGKLGGWKQFLGVEELEELDY